MLKLLIFYSRYNFFFVVLDQLVLFENELQVVVADWFGDKLAHSACARLVLECFFRESRQTYNIGFLHIAWHFRVHLKYGFRSVWPIHKGHAVVK